MAAYLSLPSFLEQVGYLYSPFISASCHDLAQTPTRKKWDPIVYMVMQ